MNFPVTQPPEPLRRHIPITTLTVVAFVVISPVPTNSQYLSDSPDNSNNFQPSLAVVVGVLTIIFSLTFLLLLYAKCCHRSTYRNQERLGNLNRSASRCSGVDKTIVESLPFFRFSTLKGWRDGLECSVCLSKYEDVEILRLLPRCKHAFHIDCVDQWLEKHSSCPLCRCKVSEDDIALFAHSKSLRFLNNNNPSEQNSNLELFIERQGSARFGSGRSFRKMKIDESGEKESKLEEGDLDEEMLHKFNHRIVISDYHPDNHDLIMMNNRWSNVSSSDLMLLKSFDSFDKIQEMEGKYRDDHRKAMEINDDRHTELVKEIGRKVEFERKIERLEIKEEEGKTGMSSVEKRSMSEIIVHPRFLGEEDRIKGGEISVKEERLRRLWLPIVRRTVEWFANRERRSANPDQHPKINTGTQESSLDV